MTLRGDLANHLPCLPTLYLNWRKWNVDDWDSPRYWTLTTSTTRECLTQAHTPAQEPVEVEEEEVLVVVPCRILVAWEVLPPILRTLPTTTTTPPRKEMIKTRPKRT